MTEEKTVSIWAEVRGCCILVLLIGILLPCMVGLYVKNPIAFYIVLYIVLGIIIGIILDYILFRFWYHLEKKKEK